MTGAFLVLNGRQNRFRSIVIPVDGIEVEELSPGPFLWLGLRENFLKKIILLNVNLGAPSDCKKIRRRRINQNNDRVLKELKKSTYTM